MDTNKASFSNLAARSQLQSRRARFARFWRTVWPLAARAGVSLLILGLWLHFSSIDARQVLQALGTLPAVTLLGALAAGVAATFVAAVKYLLLLRAQGVHIGLLRVWQFNCIAGFYGLVLPGTESGNAVKALLLGRVSRRAAGVWAATLADQLSLLLAFALIAFPGVTFIATDAQLAGRPAWIAGTGLALGGTLDLHVLFLAPPFAALIQRLLRPVSRLWRRALAGRCAGQPLRKLGFRTLARCARSRAATGFPHSRSRWSLARPYLLRWRGKRDTSDTPAQEEGWLARFWQGMASYQQHLPTLAICLFLSACYEGLLVLAAYQFALGLGIQVSFLNLLWIMALVFTSQALPITFAGIGVRDVALTYLLGGLGVPGAEAIALSFALLALNVALGLPGSVLQIFLPAAPPGGSAAQPQPE